MPISRAIRAAVTALLAATLVTGDIVAANATPSAATTASVKTTAVPFPKAPRPTISGAHKVGARLTARLGSWRPSRATVRYRWNANGHPIKAATHRTFRVRRIDAGKRITVTVKVTKTGYIPTKRTSRPITIARPVVVAIHGDGSYRVGRDIRPGTYVTTGSTRYCYWSRVSSFDGSLSSILANDIGSGQRIVTIAAGDYGVTFDDCGSWTRVAYAKRPATVREGVYLVGTQMAAGEWVASNSSGGCYWATLDGFSGELDDIIANDFTGGGRVVVDIPSSAVGFESSDCGAWKKVG